VVPRWLIFNNAKIAEVQHLDFFDSLDASHIGRGPLEVNYRKKS
jgi:hypothetical protein